jgi:hypothetical protein
MREAASMVDDAGITPHMARATVEVQGAVAALRSTGVFAGVPAEAEWRALADAVRDAVQSEARR